MAGKEIFLSAAICGYIVQWPMVIMIQSSCEQKKIDSQFLGLPASKTKVRYGFVGDGR